MSSNLETTRRVNEELENEIKKLNELIEEKDRSIKNLTVEKTDLHNL